MDGSPPGFNAGGTKAGFKVYPNALNNTTKDAFPFPTGKINDRQLLAPTGHTP
jgi:hypothetical protein